MAGAGLLSAAEFAKKLGIPASVFGAVGGAMGLFNAGELAKKFGIPASVFGTDGAGVGLLNTAELAKKLGTLVCVGAGGASAAGLLSAAEFAKKLGMLDPVDEVSGVDTLLVSGVGAVRDIIGGCLAGVAVEGCPKKDEAGLGGCSAAEVEALAVAVG